MKTLLDILKLTTGHFEKRSVPDPRLSAELIISHVLNMERLDLYLRFDRLMKEAELSEIRKLLKRRAEHEPVQYILGEVEFFGIPFKINKSVLIPRSDTEILVEAAAEYIGERDLSVLEIGTGSGCIAVAVAAECPNMRITATDISDDILTTASGNAFLNGLGERITFIEQDILSELPAEKYDVIVSNPPYISNEVIGTLDKQVKDFEPAGALTDNADGLTFYKRIKDILPDILKKNGAVFLEIGYDQAGDVIKIFEGCFSNYEIIKDLSGNDRVFFGSK